MKSNLQKGRDIVSKYMYISTSLDNLCDDITSLNVSDFNAKYNTHFASEYNFKKYIYRLYNTYFKQAKKSSVDYTYKVRIKKALDQRNKKIIPISDWFLFMLSSYANQFDTEKVVLYNNQKSTRAYYGYYAQLTSNLHTIFLDSFYSNLDFFQDYFVRIILSETAYLKCQRTDKSFSYYYYNDTGLIQLRFFYQDNLTERSVNTPPLVFYFDSARKMYKIKDFEHQLNRIFKKEDLNKKYETEDSPDFDVDIKIIMKYVLVYSFGLSQTQFDERKQEIGLRKSIYLRY